MDEIDRLVEQPEEVTRRAVNAVALEFDMGEGKAKEVVRDGLLEALKVDEELFALQAEGHPPILSVAVDMPPGPNNRQIYRVHLDFAPGAVDLTKLRGIIKDNLAAELQAAS